MYNLGTALVRIAERENATAPIEDAITAFREALKERTRERLPLKRRSRAGRVRFNPPSRRGSGLRSAPGQIEAQWVRPKVL